MSIGTAVWFGILVVILLLALLQLPKFWSKGVPYPSSAPGWWLWGDQLWKGYLRALPFAVAGGAVLFVLGVSALALPADEDASGLDVPVWYAVLFFGYFACFWLLVAAVMLFNWPKFLVPPPKRDEEGAVAAWMKSRRMRSQV